MKNKKKLFVIACILIFVLAFASILLMKQRADIWREQDAYWVQINEYFISICEPVLSCSDYLQVEEKYNSLEMRELIDEFYSYWAEYEEFCRKNDFRITFAFEKEQVNEVIKDLPILEQKLRPIEPKDWPVVLEQIQANSQKNVTRWRKNIESCKERLHKPWQYYLNI